MSRKAAREVAVHIVYDYGFNSEAGEESLRYFLSREFADSIAEDTDIYARISETQHAYIKSVVEGIAAHCGEIDGEIEKYAVGWNLNRISRIAMAIMRVAIYEIEYIDDVPERVAINEAIEIAKKYDTTETVSFINGILGSFTRAE